MRKGDIDNETRERKIGTESLQLCKNYKFSEYLIPNNRLMTKNRLGENIVAIVSK